MMNDFNTEEALVFLIFSLIALVIAIFIIRSWIKKLVQLSEKEDKSKMWICLLTGLKFTPLAGWIVGFFLN